MSLTAIVVRLDCGYESDRKAAEDAGFKIGDRLEVKDISMGQSHTTVYLKEDGRGYNSVFFSFEESGKPINIYNDPRYNPYLEGLC